VSHVYLCVCLDVMARCVVLLFYTFIAHCSAPWIAAQHVTTANGCENDDSSHVNMMNSASQFGDHADQETPNGLSLWMTPCGPNLTT